MMGWVILIWALGICTWVAIERHYQRKDAAKPSTPFLVDDGMEVCACPWNPSTLRYDHDASCRYAA